MQFLNHEFKTYRYKSLLIFSLFASLLAFSSCNNNEEALKPTKVAVFADSQLTDKSTGGATQYSIPFFKNHLLLCKQENVDVIMIPGDLVNNAVKSFYDKVDEIIKDVYGEDESKYPEFVCSMGNHEWYTNESSEREDPHAISLFKKRARINSKNLRKTSDSYVASQSDTSANYYKVVNGIPFISVSCTNNSGLLMDQEVKELKDWLKEISNLKSVKIGGPIYVGYHYPIKDLTYSFGQGALIYSQTIDDILKDYPQVVLFTGDTHFAASNERTINQVNYTNINLGSSCYSRHVSYSPLMGKTECYYNTSGTSKDSITGEVANNYNKTPHIHIIDIDKDGNAKYNRYFSTDDPTKPTKLGLEWEIRAGIKKDDFKYTSDRYFNKEWANLMYSRDGLTWNDDAHVTFTQGADESVVTFPDVIDYHYCEHYRVTIKGDSEKHYDFVTNYYKWEENPHTNNFIIKNNDLPTGNNFSITVKAYDFFDNVSLNQLIVE